MDIYISTKKKSHITDKNIITIKDIAQVEATEAVKNKVNSICLLTKGNNSHEIIDFNTIIKAIHKEYPDATVTNTGEQVALVEFADKKKENKLIVSLKIFFICIVIFAGASTAIMSFHNDAQLNSVFERYTEIFLGKDGNVKVIELSYSAGLAIGIIVFFNHFGRRKLTDDPTPIQVEMSLYEDDVTKTMVNVLSNKKKE